MVKVIFTLTTVAIFAMLAEIPYIFGLRSFQNLTLARANALEHVGNLTGILFSLYVQEMYGVGLLFSLTLVIFGVIAILFILQLLGKIKIRQV